MGRLKQYKKLFQEYQHLGFRSPYQVLFTADMILDTIKTDVVHLVEKALHGSIKPMITSCCIRELYTLNTQGQRKGNGTETGERKEKGQHREQGVPKLKEAIDRAQGWERCRCNHLMDGPALNPLDCLLSVVDRKGGGNKFRYCVATQDDATRQCLREISAVPLIYSNRSVIVVEPMSAATAELRQREESAKFRNGIIRKKPEKRKREPESGDECDEYAAGEDDKNEGTCEAAHTGEAPVKRRKAKGPKGPNPLSVKKPQKKGREQRSKRSSKDAGTLKEFGEQKAKRKRRKKTGETGTPEGAGGAGGLDIGAGDDQVAKQGRDVAASKG